MDYTIPTHPYFLGLEARLGILITSVCGDGDNQHVCGDYMHECRQTFQGVYPAVKYATGFTEQALLILPQIWEITAEELLGYSGRTPLFCCLMQPLYNFFGLRKSPTKAATRSSDTPFMSKSTHTAFKTIKNLPASNLRLQIAVQ